MADITTIQAGDQISDSREVINDNFEAVNDELAEKATAANLAAHQANVSNPHAVTKSQVGLANADNTSDANKPVSSAQQAALDLKADAADLTAHESDTANPHSVTKSQVGLGNVDNTSDANKPVSTAQQTVLDLKLDSALIKRIYKSADETVNNSNVLQDDDHLSFNVGANEVWAITGHFTFIGHSTPDLQYDWSVPSGTTYRLFEADQLFDFTTEVTGATLIGASSFNKALTFHGVVFVSSTPGTITFRWAQNTAHASNLKLLKGSYIIATRLA